MILQSPGSIDPEPGALLWQALGLSSGKAHLKVDWGRSQHLDGSSVDAGWCM